MAASLGTIAAKNLALVGVLVLIHLLAERWASPSGAMAADLVVVASLLAFTLRLAVVQFKQQKEIAQRRQAQEELSTANDGVAQLLEDARLEAGSLAQVSQFSSLVHACSSREEIFRLIPEWFSQLLPNTSGSLSVFDLARTHVEVVAEWTGSSSIAASASATSASTNITIRAKRPPVTVPLIAGDEALGTLAIHAESQDSNADESPASGEFSRQTQLAYSVAEHLALTITSLDLRESLRIQAIRDPLTGLFNRRYMEEGLEREVRRARRGHHALAIMLLDIDHFKRYNDTFGHPAGDEALRFVAETLAHNIRAEDMACRYGGEEFLTLLPECTLHQAARRADEIRLLLKSLCEEHREETPALVTISVGVAALEDDRDTAELLVKRADGALYRAKHEGRDRVVVAQSESTQAVSGQA